MRHARTGVAALAATLVLGSMIGCGGGSSEGGPNLAQGEKLYRQTCATCHGMNGEGIDRLGKPLAGSEFVALHSTGDLVQFLIEGRPATHPDNDRGVDMPPRGGNPSLTDTDLESIVLYTRSLE